jgi:Zn-dependent dipeptidase, microsomal dipeptidase homolog
VLTLSAIALSLLHPAGFDPEPMLAPIAPADDSAQQTPIRGRLMSPAELHADSIVIDGLIIAKWNRELFEDMRKGGLTAANCTVSVWEGFQATINNIVASQTLIRDNSDLVIPVKTTADIRRAKEQGKTGIIFGFQNAHAFEDQLGYIEIFKQLGVGVVQMCYNTQNLVGTGCYERDGGLSGFGREVVAEMNRVGIMCDLSHVGSKTSEEVILESKKTGLLLPLPAVRS